MVKLNLGAGRRNTWLEGFVNLDKKYGWNFQDGLKRYNDNSVDAITISHALMYLSEPEILTFLKEVYRVLKINGVIRISEDNCEEKASDTYLVGWKGAISLTGPKMMRDLLELAGFEVYDMTKDNSLYKDNSLCQNLHERNNPKRIFFLEGIKKI